MTSNRRSFLFLVKQPAPAVAEKRSRLVVVVARQKVHVLATFNVNRKVRHYEAQCVINNLWSATLTCTVSSLSQQQLFCERRITV